MRNRKHKIKLFKKNKQIKELKINYLLHTCGHQITLKHKREQLKTMRNGGESTTQHQHKKLTKKLRDSKLIF